MQLTKYEQETVVNYNAGEPLAEVYTRDKTVIRKLDALVTAFPEVYQCVRETDIDKCYRMPKSYVTYRKPRQITEAKREQARNAMRKINNPGLL